MYLIIFATLIFTAIWNGQTINWKQSVYPYEHIKWSKRWHRTGFIIRALLFAPFILFGAPLWQTLTFLTLAYPAYNIIINLYIGQHPLYIGRTAYIDKLIPVEIHYTIYLALPAMAIYTAIDPQLMAMQNIIDLIF